MDLKQSSFSRELEAATLDGVYQQYAGEPERALPHTPVVHTYVKSLQFIRVANEHYHMDEYQDYVYYFLTGQNFQKSELNPLKAEFKLIIYSFVKKDGQFRSKTLNELKGTPQCITSGLMAIPKEKAKEEEDMVDEGNRIQDKNDFKIVVLIGLKEGFIKIVELSTVITTDGPQTRPIYCSHKLEQKPLKFITIADKMHYGQKNICFIMFEDCKIFVFNYLSKHIICVYQPPILGIDHAVAFSLHESGRYIATASRAGMVVFWELNQRALSAIDKSEDRIEKIQIYENEQEVVEKVWSFKYADRVVSCSPMGHLHSASIQGLKWITFMGNMVAMVTSKGIFKLVALNFDSKDEYIVLIKYQIPDGEAIESVQLFPDEEKVVVFKSYKFTHEFDCQVEKRLNKGTQLPTVFDHQYFMLQTDNNYYKFNYKALEERQNPHNCIEVFKFGLDLKINKIERYEFKFKGHSGKLGDYKFESGVMARDQSVVMMRDSRGFYIGSLRKGNHTIDSSY